MERRKNSEKQSKETIEELTNTNYNNDNVTNRIL